MKTLFLVANSVSTQDTVDQKQFQPSDIPVAGKLDQVEALPGGGQEEGCGLPPAAGLHTTDGVSAKKQTNSLNFDFRNSPW